MKFCIKSETPLWKKKRKERKKFWRRHSYVRTKWCFVRTKIFGKRIRQTHVNKRVSQTHWNPTLIKNTKKTKTPTNNARKKKWCVPRWKVAFSALTCEVLGSPGGNALAVLYRRYCVELNVYDGWYISRARAGRTFFCSYFFCILGRGFHQWGLKTIMSWVCGTLLPKKHVFLKKEQKLNWVSPPLALFLFIIRGLTLL
jgi:hypothetical protein